MRLVVVHTLLALAFPIVAAAQDPVHKTVERASVPPNPKAAPTAHSASDQIRIDLQVIEVSLTEMRNLGMDFASLKEKGQLQTGSRPDVAAMIAALAKADACTVIAEPSLITVSGRPATFSSCGEIPTLTPAADPKAPPTVIVRKIGTQMDVVSILGANDKARLEIRVRLARPDKSLDVPVPGGVMPGIRAQEVETASEVTLGQTMIIAGETELREQKRKLPDGRDSSKMIEVQTLILVTPSAVGVGGPDDDIALPPTATAPTDSTKR